MKGKLASESEEGEGSGPTATFNFAEHIGLSLMKSHPHIEIRPAFFPLHKMTSFIEDASPCPNCNMVYSSLLCLPSSAQLTKQDVKEVCVALKQCFRNVCG